MAFVDELKLDLTAGKGGDGVVRWLRLKGKDRMGPSGGDGGRGGDVILRAVRDLSILSNYTGSPVMKAHDGESGGANTMTGSGGDDLVLDVPVGSLVTRESDGATFEFLKEDEEVLVLKGGRGGYGNAHFKNSKNINPMEQTDGKPGESSSFFIELRFIADAGIIGLPNAGKSTLLNALTNAQSQVGDYNFTTLEPHLGVLYGYVLADIPGLIQGASEGKGLGHKFLRHILRTRMLIHCISVENEDVVAAYNLIRDELRKFDASLLSKKEYVLLTKTDEADPQALKKKREVLEAHTKQTVHTITILDAESIKSFSDFLTKELAR
jgi:GTP-binding protein